LAYCNSQDIVEDRSNAGHTQAIPTHFGHNTKDTAKENNSKRRNCVPGLNYSQILQCNAPVEDVIYIIMPLMQ
jgi:hypothetical protein